MKAQHARREHARVEVQQAVFIGNTLEPCSTYLNIPRPLLTPDRFPPSKLLPTFAKVEIFLNKSDPHMQLSSS
ncbi:hypothetical protein CONPUDRAFT_158538 [Coniophora puteana RWD-64-598 SS2]|uniref:Uncharacterized protein n=1 Tax=Coniophora puteana (strain RWD-64-598) TaxID=741705 RepID=A0A5M3MBB4_CONPW|nr:uncharacterized protein CONPUDRAFT_158538 [Coniophora puteana RWD-64-598 SS2]EIW76522.1 hypothetical protein CONPUDRAFT_158538 [Coniophora puteana RWD-64-598 SS2]